MKKISWVTHTNYDIPLPENHKFTASKFSDLYNELKNSNPSKIHSDPLQKPFKNDVLLSHETGSESESRGPPKGVLPPDS